MVNDTADSNSQEAVPCFALSKNDAYLFSASGGVISLYIVMTFKVSSRNVWITTTIQNFVMLNHTWLTSDDFLYLRLNNHAKLLS